MLNNYFSSTLALITDNQNTPLTFCICAISSLILGFLIANFFLFRCNPSKNLYVTIALLPMMVQTIIMLVNGRLGTAVAVAGAFSLVRFRSLNGNAKEISAVFLAMSTGLATGVGQVEIAFVYVAIILIFNVAYTLLNVGNPNPSQKQLKVTIPENLDYTGLFDDIFQKYTTYSELEKVRTTNMGSLYQLFYSIRLKDISEEKNMLDEIRVRNGNLDILCSKPFRGKDVL